MFVENKGAGFDDGSPRNALLGKINNSVNSIVDQAIPAEAFYVPNDIKSKRSRRTKAAIGSVRDTIKGILELNNPQTVRQVFYALTVRGCISKEEIEYKRTVVRLLTEMRESGEVPFDWIADNTRLMRKPSSFTGV